MGQRKHQWEEVRQAYLEGLTGPQGAPMPSLRDIAARFNIPYHTVRLKAAADKWGRAVPTTRQTISEQATQIIVRAAAETEADIRQRQAAQGKQAALLALEALETLRPEEMAPKDIIALLRLGTELERAALGMDVQKVQVSNPDSEREAVRDAIRKTIAILSKHPPEKVIEG